MSHCKPKKLGPVFMSDAIFRCFPNEPVHSRRPDVSFIRQERLSDDWLADNYFSIAPDLAVEVLSPNDLAYKVDAKIRLYLKVGLPLVWVINPEQRSVTVFRADGSVTLLNEDDVLEGEQVITGFKCLCRDLYPAR